MSIERVAQAEAEIAKRIGDSNPDSLCYTCGHTREQHASSSYLYCSMTTFGGADCSCTKFVYLDFIYPRLPTAEEVYEMLRSS